MDRCTGSVLESYLSDYGWVFQTDAEHQWKTGFHGESCHFPLVIILSDTWVSFHIDPFLQIAIDWESWPEIALFLLELNARHPMLKIGVSTHGHIELSMDVLNRAMDYENFCLALSLLGFYADLIYDEVLSHLDHIGFRYSETLSLLT